MCGLSGEFLLRILLLNMVYFENNFMTCEELSNNVFNANIRDYVKEDDSNSSQVRTLQKEEVGRYASFAPIRNPIRFKEIPDNALSGSSYSRGLLHHEHGGHEGYGIHDGYYEDGSPYGHGYGYVHDDHHDYEHHDGHGHYNGHGHHDGHGHHEGHGHHGGHGHGHYGHHLEHGHHHKHHDHHHLATKALLWPIAGIALLGAAAALVTNPVLLQLGVVSGKRRRRDTMEASDMDSDDWPMDLAYRSDEKNKNKRPLRNVKLGKKVLPSSASHVSKTDNDRFIPIPLKLKKDN